MNPAMILQAVRTAEVLRLIVLIAAVALAIGAIACERTDEVGPPATTIPPTQPVTAPTDTPASEVVSEGAVSVGTPDDAASLSLEPTVEGSLEREPQATPPALLPGTAEPTPPTIRAGTTPESEGPTGPASEPAPTDTPVPPPTDTPTPVPPTTEPERPTPPTGNRIGQSAPDFEVTTIDGVTRSLTDYKEANQAVILYFFSST